MIHVLFLLSQCLRKYGVVSSTFLQFLLQAHSLTCFDPKQLKQNDFCFPLLLTCYGAVASNVSFIITKYTGFVLTLVCISDFKKIMPGLKKLLSLIVNWSSLKCLCVKIFWNVESQKFHPLQCWTASCRKDFRRSPVIRHHSNEL